MTRTEERIIAALPDHGDGLLARDVVAKLPDMDPNVVKVYLCNMHKRNLIFREDFKGGQRNDVFVYSKLPTGGTP